MHYTLYLHCFNIFWYFDRIQTTTYRIVLRQFPLALFSSFVCCRCSIFCLFVHPNSTGFTLTRENSTNTQNDANKRLISLSPSSSSSACSILLFFFFELAVFFSSKYTIRWPSILLLLPHNQYVLCYLLRCRQCCRCCFVLEKSIAFSSPRPNDFVISILSLSLPHEQCNEERSNE